jgi:methyltransferase (TIGR00027 family)
MTARWCVKDEPRYVPWDFEQDPPVGLPGRLAAEGLDATQPVLTIWEGVIMYLTEAAVGETIACVRQYSRPGSQLVFNYTAPDHLQRRRALRRLAALVGEPVRFGWRPADLPEWLERRGFALRWDRDDAELAARLLPARLATAGPWAGGRVALAEPTRG